MPKRHIANDLEFTEHFSVTINSEMLLWRLSPICSFPRVNRWNWLNAHIALSKKSCRSFASAAFSLLQYSE